MRDRSADRPLRSSPAETKELLEKCARGSSEAWSKLVDRVADLTYSVCAQTLSLYRSDCPKSDVEDACQEVFLRLIKDEYRLLRAYDPSRASLETWLTLVSRSTAIDWLRRLRPAAVALDALPASSSPSSPPAADARSVPTDLLSRRQALVLRLLFDADMEVRDVARRLGVSEQTVRSTKHKALEILRRHFGVAKKK
jgi:DNA-directed RNA polymerase specialized sigma24 family protein